VSVAWVAGRGTRLALARAREQRIAQQYSTRVRAAQLPRRQPLDLGTTAAGRCADRERFLAGAGHRRSVRWVLSPLSVVRGAGVDDRRRVVVEQARQQVDDHRRLRRVERTAGRVQSGRECSSTIPRRHCTICCAAA